MGVDIGGAEVGLVSKGAHDGGAGDRKRSGVYPTDVGARRSAVESVANFGIRGGGGDFQIKGGVMDSPVHREFGVSHKATEGVAIQTTR